MSRLGQRENELSVIASAASISTPIQGRENIVRLLDDFEIIGPNGSHTVFVSEVMWSIDHRNVRTMWDNRILAYQCFLALRYLHYQGFVHGGEPYANLILSSCLINPASDISQRSFYLEMRENRPERFRSLRERMDLPYCRPFLSSNIMNPRAHPKYVCAPSSLMDATHDDSFFSDVNVEDLRILLSGFGYGTQAQ